MEEEIKTLWEQINHKGDFVVELAEKVERSPKTLKVHWFSNDPINGIPKDKKALVIKELRKKIKNQKQPA